jgi:CubicO group peptidase (beta-lactamase class C family)
MLRRAIGPGLGSSFCATVFGRGNESCPKVGWQQAYGRRAAPEGIYGAHLWLKMPISRNHGEPPLPEDAYYMLGHDGQTVAVIPSLDLVIVRMGLARKREVWKPAKVLAPIVEAFSRHGE